MAGNRALEQILEGVEQGVVTTDRAFVVRSVNAAAEQLLGRARAEVVGHHLGEFVTGTYGGEEPDAGTSWRFERLRGGWAAYASETPAGVGGKWVQRMVEAEQLAAVGQLAAGVAHEIGAPLTAISVAVEYLLKRECGSCQFASRDLEVILTQTRRIAQLARRLVDLARPGEPVLRMVDLNAVVTEGFELVEKQLRRSGLEPLLELDPALPPVRADAGQLQQVLLNFVLNAQHALADAGGRVEVRTRWAAPYAELVVSDTGPGIAPEDLPRIFLPFFSRSGGTGLGLPLARQIVHQHGGTIQVETARGQGATFIARLPVNTHG
ncbi:MAG: PAS domain-containing protein [Gemmatimonadetes bacterium]|nr:PAS domain-containing protein [Gemmatimonadota bacterium]